MSDDRFGGHLPDDRDRLGVFVLAALTSLFFGAILFLDSAAFWGDLILAFYPAQSIWSEYALNRSLPTWNPFLFNGFPIFADSQYSAFYPSLALNLLLPLHRAMAVDLALHILLMGTFTYAFLRRQGVPFGPALLGAITFAFSGFVAVRITQPSLLRTAAWFPLVLILVQRIAVTNRLRLIAYLGIVLAAQLLAGHLQTMLLSTMLAGVYGLWQAALPPQGRSGRLRRVGGVAIGLTGASALSLALAAVQVLPNLELATHSDRSGGTGYQFATSFSMPVRQLPMLLAPHLFGNPATGHYLGQWNYWEMIGYAGVVPVLLALVGVAFSRERSRFFWAAAVVAGVVMALGDGTPVYRLAYRFVPGLAFFRVPARFLLYYVFGIAVLVAYGVHSLQSQALPVRRWRALLTVLTLVGLVLLVVGTGVPGAVSLLKGVAEGTVGTGARSPGRELAIEYLKETGVGEARHVALLWMAGLSLMVLMRSRVLGVALATGLLAVLTVGDLFAFGSSFYPTVQPAQFVRGARTETTLDLEQGAYRILTTPAFVNRMWSGFITSSFIPAREPQEFHRFRGALTPNINILDRVPNATGYSPITLARMSEYGGLAIADATRRGGRSPLLDFVGARYVFTFANLTQHYTAAYREERFPGYGVWHNPRALPRGYLVTDFRVRPPEQPMEEVFLRSWDPARTVILEVLPRETFGLQPATRAGRIVTRAYGLSMLSFGLELPGPAIFVLSDTYYPGWRARVDGKEYPIYRANHAFRAVFLPAGARHLEFTFEPGSLRIGLVVSVVAWLVLGILLVAGAVARREVGKIGAGGME